MKPGKLLVCLTLSAIILGLTTLASATPKTYYFTGTITFTGDNMERTVLPHDSVKIGDAFSGSFSFDLSGARKIYLNSIASSYISVGESHLIAGSLEWNQSPETMITIVDNGTGRSTTLSFDGPRLIQSSYPGLGHQNLPSSLEGDFFFTYSEMRDGVDFVVEGETSYFSTTPIPPPPESINTMIFNAVEIGWTSVSGQIYQVQYSTNLVSSNWFNLGSAVIGNGSTNSVFDSTRQNSQRHYKVIAE